MSGKIIVILIWVLILLVGPLTVLTSISLDTALKDPALLINFFQRLTGLTAFSLIFCQILLGSYINHWTKYLGSKPIRYHILQGLITYGFILAHPALYVIFSYKTVGSIFSAIIPNFSTETLKYELYLSYGRIAFTLLTIGVFAGYFRTRPFMRRNWRKFHILNYFSFFFVALHAWNIGSDTKNPPFIYLFFIAIGVISYTILKRFIFWRVNASLGIKV